MYRIVKIIKSGSERYWYRFKIGETFTVSEFGDEDWVVVDGPYSGNDDISYLIKKSDCESTISSIVEYNDIKHKFI